MLVYQRGLVCKNLLAYEFDEDSIATIAVPRRFLDGHISDGQFLDGQILDRALWDTF